MLTGVAIATERVCVLLMLMPSKPLLSNWVQNGRGTESRACKRSQKKKMLFHPLGGKPREKMQM